MSVLQVILPGDCSERLQDVLTYSLCGTRCIQHDAMDIAVDGPVLFAASVYASGVNTSLCALLHQLRTYPGLLGGRMGGVIIDGETELYTKSVGRDIVLAANMCGCTFPGRPLVEGTGSLSNFSILARNAGESTLQSYKNAARELIGRVVAYQKPSLKRPRLLVLHASNRETSNTLALWSMVRQHIETDMEIQEITLRNGAVSDCMGCSYTTCLHFSEKGNCFYGGVMVDEVYPALENCDALLLLCPNYNDAVSANISAFINRLTSLFLKTRFYEKSLFGIVVSGYSGGDIVASQLISGLNMNKTFQLPPNFCMLETANAPGSILESEGIGMRARAFAQNMKRHLMG